MRKLLSDLIDPKTQIEIVKRYRSLKEMYPFDEPSPVGHPDSRSGLAREFKVAPNTIRKIINKHEHLEIY